METNSYIINNNEDKKKVFDNLNNVFDNLNNVFDNLNNVFDKDLFEYTKKIKNIKKGNINLDDDFEITDEDILVKLLSINKHLIQKKDNLRTKIYRKIFYLKKFSILNDCEEYIKAMKLFEDENENETEYNEFKKAMELFEDENQYYEFKKFVDKYYNINKLIQAIKFYSNNLKNQS